MRTRGFSLIELLIVVAVMATLTSGTVVAFGDTVDWSASSTREHNRTVIRRAVDEFRADAGHYPAELSDLVTGRYLREVPVDPVTGTTDWTLVPSAPGACDVYDVQPPSSRGGI